MFFYELSTRNHFFVKIKFSSKSQNQEDLKCVSGKARSLIISKSSQLTEIDHNHSHYLISENFEIRTKVEGFFQDREIPVFYVIINGNKEDLLRISGLLTAGNKILVISRYLILVISASKKV